MEFREFTGKTVEDAIIEAATTLGRASSDLDIEVVSNGTSGFFGIGAKPAVIKAKAKKEVNEDIDDVLSKAKKPTRTGKKPVAPKNTEKTDNNSSVKEEVKKEETKKDNFKKDIKKDDFGKDSKKDDFKKEESKKNDFKKDTFNKNSFKKDDSSFDDSFDDEDIKAAQDKNENVVIDDSIIDETKEYLRKIFDAMELESKIDITLDKQSRTMSIDVEGPEMGIIIGKRGQTLDSLQYLVSLFVNKKSETYIRVKLDTENYRERRRETLENLAKNIAFKVKKSRRSFTLEPMNPYERRIIHSTLQNDKYVTTKSEGEEPYRKVIIYPKRYNNNNR